MPVDETMVYELVLVWPASRKILAIDSAGVRSLPRVHIPRWTRPAEQLQKEIRATLGLYVIVLDVFVPQENGARRAVTELLLPSTNSDLREVSLDDIPATMADKNLESSAFSCSKRPLSQLGWIDEAITWLESATGRKLSSKSSIEQLNGGGSFSLLRFQMDDGSHYWLKATGEPNAHERSITCFLSELCAEYLPQLISSRPSWNAWLMLEETTQVMPWPTEPAEFLQVLEGAVESMAELQMRTAGRHADLLNAGAFDQRIEVFQEHSEAVFGYLEEVMSLQISTKVPALKSSRLRELRALVDGVCHRTQDLGLPETVVHGNLTPGNILLGPRHCQFIDWCESYVGNPLIALQHLLLLNKAENVHSRQLINRILKQSYRDAWAEILDPAAIEAGFRYMPLLAILSSLVGRGDWLSSPKRNDPQRQSYARSLARYMDRAACEPELTEVLSQ